MTSDVEQNDVDNLGRVRLGYSEIRISSDPENSDLRPQTLKTQTPRNYFKKIYIVKSSQFLSPNVLWSRNVLSFATARKKRDIYLLRLSRRSISEKLTRLKIAADNLIVFAGEFFYRRNKRHRIAIMLFNLKSVLNPPDATVINRRR